MEDAEENLESSAGVLTQCGPLWEEGGSGSRLSGNQGVNEGRTENSKARASPTEEDKANKNQLPKEIRGSAWGHIMKRNEDPTCPVWTFQ